MRRDVVFLSKGMRCSGWLYVPESLSPGRKAPAIVMAHGFSAVKEMHLSTFAERFEKEDFVTLVFDFRHLGGSEGEPRGQIFWREQVEDYKNAITWVSDQPEVDPDRIGIWGTSFSGGHVLYVSAYDKRVKAVVCQVNGGANSWDLSTVRGQDPFRQHLQFLTQDRISRYRTGVVNTLKVVAPAGEPSLIGGEDAYEWFMEASMLAPSWTNQVTVESLETMLEYDLSLVVPRIAPTPLLMILAEKETLFPLDMARKAFEGALEPKSLRILSCGHFDVYAKEPWVGQATEAAAQWFDKYLFPSRH